VAWRIGAGLPTYALEGSVFVCGAAIQWLRDGLGIIASAAETEALAASVPDAGGVTFVPAFVGLGAPHWQPDVRGALLGLTRGATRAHIVRAALEAACFQSRDVLEALAGDSGDRIGSIRADGGMARNDLFLQMQADLAGVPVERPAETETTALGAALLAAIGAGLIADEDQAATLWRPDRVFEPRMTADERESRYEAWHRSVTMLCEAQGR
jgi:glycerol kinase